MSLLILVKMDVVNMNSSYLSGQDQLDKAKIVVDNVFRVFKCRSLDRKAPLEET